MIGRCRLLAAGPVEDRYWGGHTTSRDSLSTRGVLFDLQLAYLAADRLAGRECPHLVSPYRPDIAGKHRPRGLPRAFARLPHRVRMGINVGDFLVPCGKNGAYLLYNRKIYEGCNPFYLIVAIAFCLWFIVTDI